MSNLAIHLGPKINEDFIQAVREDGLIYESKNLWVSIKATNFKAPGMYCSNCISLHRGRIFVCQNRLVLIAGKRKLLDLPKNHEWFALVEFDRSNQKRLIVKLDLDKLPNDFHGQVAYSYRIDPKEVPI
jgi:hypothetical protein